MREGLVGFGVESRSGAEPGAERGARAWLWAGPAVVICASSHSPCCAQPEEGAFKFGDRARGEGLGEKLVFGVDGALSAIGLDGEADILAGEFDELDEGKEAIVGEEAPDGTARLG